MRTKTNIFLERRLAKSLSYNITLLVPWRSR